MMTKRHTKLSLILPLLAVMLIALFTCAACSSSAYAIKLERSAITLDKGETANLEYQLTKNGEEDTETEVVVSLSGDSVTYSEETKKITAVKAGKSELTLSVKGNSKTTAKLTVNVPLYEIEIKGGASQKADFGGEDIVEYTVLKDGTKVTDKKVIVSVEGDALKYEKVGNRIYFVKEGTAKVKAALESDPSVFAEKTYTVEKSFWNSGDHQVNKDGMTITDNSVYIPGGNGSQYFLGVLEGGTKYLFKTKLTIPSPSALGSQTVGVTHDLDRNNAGLWFGINSPDGANGGKYRIYVKNFYGGWAGQDFVKYTNVEFSSDTVEVITVRDGNKFWFSIDGYCGTFTLPAAGDKNYISADTQTWAGIFSQERKLTATDFSYTLDEEAIAEAKTLCESPVAKFEITNSGVNKLVKGTSFTYTAKVIASDPANVPAVDWSLDKSAMTSGADGTAIADGTLMLAADAAGVVTVVATCGGKEVRIDVAILSESLADENETVKVDGGVVLGADGTVTFTEEFNYNNATLGDTDYTEVYYSATLKNKVKGDFEFAFTLTDMKSSATPKFMVSLGNSLGNFIFTSNGVSVKTQYVDTATKEFMEGALTAQFAAADTLEVVIKVVGGHYKVTVNGTELDFGGKDPVRRVEDYGAERPVLFTTGAGTSVKVSAISLTDKADADFIVLNDNTTVVTGGIQSVMIPPVNNSWVGKDKGLSTTFWGGLLPEGDYTVSMNVKFSAPMADAKLGIQIGNFEYHVNNKVKSSNIIHGQLYAGSWGDAPGNNSNITTVNNAFNVSIKKISGTVYFFIGDTLIASHANAPADRILKFWTFDDGSTPVSDNVAVTDLTVTEGATIINISGDNAVQVGNSATYTVQVLGGNEDDIVWALNKDGLTAGKDGTSFDAATRTLTFANDAAGTVVITATLGGVTAEFTVTASDQPADQNTALAESKGGVKQDVANGKLIFDDAAANGVTSEDKYSEASGYYAILNTAANTRATIQDNFILEFTVSDYVTTAQYPKLMISLGGKFEQFYVVYKNGKGQIQTFTHAYNNGSTKYDGGWINSAEFDAAASQTFKIVCEDGFYKVYVDNTEITGWNEDGNSRTLIRNPENMGKPCNVMFSTNADTTATVSNISLKAVTGKEGKVTTHLSNSISVNEATEEVTFTFTNAQVFEPANQYVFADRIYTHGAVGANSEITFEVKFNDAMSDGKLCVKFDSDRAMSIISAGSNIKGEYIWAWGGSEKANTNFLVDGKIKVKIIVTNNVAKGYLWETSTNDYTYLIGGNQSEVSSNGVISFCTVGAGDDVGKTVTISNISVTNS